MKRSVAYIQRVRLLPIIPPWHDSFRSAVSSRLRDAPQRSTDKVEYQFQKQAVARMSPGSQTSPVQLVCRAALYVLQLMRLTWVYT